MFIPIARNPNNNTAHLLWKAIANRCQSINDSLRLVLEDKYHRTVMNEKENLRTYLDRIEEITNQLAQMNIIIPEERIYSKILATLLPKYDSVRLTAIMQPQENQTLATLRNQFSIEGAMMKPTQKKEGALFTKDKKGGKKYKPGVICHYCSKEGHFESDCRSKKARQRKPLQ